MSAITTVDSNIARLQFMSQEPETPVSRRLMDGGREKFPSFEDTRPHSQQSMPISNIRRYSQDQKTPLPYAPFEPTSRRSGDGIKDDSSRRHRPKKSVSEAFGNFRQRRGSFSANTQDLAEALKAPISYKLIGLCIIWYMTSALTNTSFKSIVNVFPKPVTLTIFQFICVSFWCLVFAWLASIFPGLKTAIPALKNGIRHPSREVIATAMPLSVFQFLGHLLSSTAMARIPVSLVHTIKGLSPLFTVLAYRLIFRIRYARATYLSLVPLTAGVMIACSTDFSGNFIGILCAFLAALVFVAQNIFSKKLFNEASRAAAESGTHQHRKLDKLNLLFYCSGGAFVLNIPVWFLSEGVPMINEMWQEGTLRLQGDQIPSDHGALFLEFMLNGIFHFGQNIMAFVLLSMLTPISYSVASLIKRVWVIVTAIVWFRNPTTPIQAFGVGLTFFGLYLYDRNSMDDAAERRVKVEESRTAPTLLPLAEEPAKQTLNGSISFLGPGPADQTVISPVSSSKKDDNLKTGSGTVGNNAAHEWLPPGTKQESTWEPDDRQAIQI